MHNFKKAVLSTLALLLVMAVCFSLYAFPYFHGTSYFYQDAKERNDLAGTLDLLVVGSSHALYAFDTEILDRELGCSSYNLAYEMQTMRGRYFLLRKELQRNPVKTVILEVSYNALTRNRKAEGPEGDIYQLGRFSNPLERLRYFFFTISPSEYPKLFFDTLDRAGTAWEKYSDGKVTAPTGKGFRGREAAKDLTVTAEDLGSLYHTASARTEMYEDNVFYFEKILELCREKGVRIILAVTPLSQHQLVRVSGYEKVMACYDDYAQQYGCELYDFNLKTSRLDDYAMDTGFYDATHLTKASAALFTQQFCDILNMADAGEDTSHLFLPDYETAIAQTVDYIKAQ